MQNNATNLSDTETDDLAPGHSLLYGQYTIERHMIDGGFGMTYLAKDSLDRKVVIKECFPISVCRRINNEVRPRKPAYQDQYQNVIRNFLREALRMAKFDHPNIVKVHQVFQENNTAYIAMDYIDGMDLLSMLDIDPGRLTDTRIDQLLRDTLKALEHVHSFGMLHRDISPDNLLLDANDKLTLIDFGAAREDATQQTRALSTLMSVKDGYSPHEFYYTDGKQRPSSDIYSVGATFYHLITGYAPPNCQKRVADLSTDKADPYKPLADGNWSFDKVFLSAIDKALSLAQSERFQTVEEWLDLLDNPHSHALPSPVSEDLEVHEEQSAQNTAIDTDQSAPQAVETAPDAVSEPAAETDLEPELIAKISSLVEDTNSQVEQGHPGDAKAALIEEVVEDEEEHHLVDIFGQPIDDIDKWLKEQDKLSKRSAKKSDAAATPKNKKIKKAKEAAETRSEQGLLRVFNRLTGLRQRSAVLAQN